MQPLKYPLHGHYTTFKRWECVQYVPTFSRGQSEHNIILCDCKLYVIVTEEYQTKKLI